MKHERIIRGAYYRHTSGMIGRATIVSNFQEGPSRVYLTWSRRMDLQPSTEIAVMVWGNELTPATFSEIMMGMERMPRPTVPNIPETPPPPPGPKRKRWEQRGARPAFPRASEVSPSGEVVSQGAPGMDLRDWFAGMALSGIMSQAMFHPADNNPFERYASLAYTAADAMLQAREKEMDD